MTAPNGQCTALNVSDQLRCEEVATSVNGLFCSFHSRQCQGLYRGYKNRNAQLDALDQNPPTYLASTSNLVNQTFADIDSEDVLHDVYDHLAAKHSLLDRVIRARKLHHSRFFAMNLDYGHQQYLDALASQRFVVLRALERLERRTAEVLYEKQKWFKWVRQCQDTEEAHRDKEQKKVRQEAQMFRRHQQEMQVHAAEMRAKERARRQEAELDKAYLERMSEQERERREAEWDPIEEVIHDERGTFVDLIKHLLLKANDTQVSGSGPSDTLYANPDKDSPLSPQTTNTANDPVTQVKPKKSKKSKAKTSEEVKKVPNKDESLQETKAQMRLRLKEGSRVEITSGPHVAGTIENPVLSRKTSPLAYHEIEFLLEDIAEIKLLLFCRLLLSHASALPAAIRANSVDDFLNDPEVTDSDLRDLALKMDNSGLQEIRDACADLRRGDDEDLIVFSDDEDSEDSGVETDEDEEILAYQAFSKYRKMYKGRHEEISKDQWSSEREVQSESRQMGPPKAVTDGMKATMETTLIDFGDADDQGTFTSRKIWVKICGKHIYNYPSEKAVSRAGWLHFCILAKDSNLYDAIYLCRRWEEFWELNILSIFGYFPSGKWSMWKGELFRQNLLKIGFIPYFQFGDAEEMSSNQQTGSRQQQFRRAHNVAEYRNFICAHVNRKDPASRRFLQRLSMQTSKLLVFIRDAKTGRTIHKPPSRGPDEQPNTWLARHKSGLGRAVKNQWTVTAEIGPKFFEAMEKERKWHFGFNDYYDVYVWDLVPGKHSCHLFNAIQETMIKAKRFPTMHSLYDSMEPILRTLTREPDTQRTRDIRPGEEAKSIWDDIKSSNVTFLDPHSEDGRAADPGAEICYQEADALEDSVLFPEGQGKALFKSKLNAVEKFVKTFPDWDRFINDFSTTDEEAEWCKIGKLQPFERDLANADSEESDDSELEEGSVDSKSSETSEDSTESSKQCGQDSVVSIKYAKRLGLDDRNIHHITAGSRLGALSKESKKDLAVMRDWDNPYVNHEGERNTMADFMTFVDRERSRFYNRSWREGDLTPGSEERWKEARRFVKIARTHNLKQAPFRCLSDLKFLDIHPGRHRRIVPDMIEARAMMTPYFDPSVPGADHDISETASPLVFDQTLRSKQLPPNIRSHVSTFYRPKEFFQEIDDLNRNKKKSSDIHDAEYEEDSKTLKRWDLVIRPIIAHLYKAGIIDAMALPWASGQAFAATEPGREDPDLFIDYREFQSVMTTSLEEPPSKEKMMAAARSYAQKNPDARFALLRCWSASHSWPLMIGADVRKPHTFMDAIGRTWEWRFISKDMPRAEWSMHNALKLHFKDHKRLLGRDVFIRRDLVMVMAENEAELLKLAIATTFLINTDPWRLEVDLWKSFVNLDYQFILDMRPEWLD